MGVRRWLGDKLASSIEETLPDPVAEQATTPLLQALLQVTDANGNSRPLPLFFPDKMSADIGRKVFAGEEYPFWKVVQALKIPPLTIVDIGANCGAFALVCALRWPSAQIFAFEPGSAAFDCMTRNVESSPSIHPFKFGLGAEDRSFALYSSLDGSVGGTLGQTERNRSAGETVEIRKASDALNSLVNTRIDILKIDTEGSEIPILSSLDDRLAEVSVIFVEYHSERDRRQIDDMLAPTHQLLHSQAMFPHRGDLCFISNELAEPWEMYRIVMSEA